MPFFGSNEVNGHEEGPYDLRGDPAQLGRVLRSCFGSNEAYRSWEDSLGLLSVPEK